MSNSWSRDDDVIAGLNLLIVDDSVTILKMMSFILSKAGAEVTQAKNGLDAVNALTNTEFDIIISDIQMPLLDGFGMTKKIRATEETIYMINSPSTRGNSRKQIIIGISADGNNREEALSSGMDAFLMKPFKLEDLVEEFSRIVEERKQDMDDNG
jgi:CheY-like chemotaxis protein